MPHLHFPTSVPNIPHKAGVFKRQTEEKKTELMRPAGCLPISFPFPSPLTLDTFSPNIRPGVHKQNTKEGLKHFQNCTANLVSVENLQESLINVWLPLEAIFDLVDIVDGVIELDGLVVLEGRCSSDGDCHRRVGLHRWGARRGVRDRGSLLAGWCMRLQLGWLRERKGRRALGEMAVPQESAARLHLGSRRML